MSNDTNCSLPCLVRFPDTLHAAGGWEVTGCSVLNALLEFPSTPLDSIRLIAPHNASPPETDASDASRAEATKEPP